MKHLQHNNQDHVLFRTSSDGDSNGHSYYECVRTSDGKIVKVTLSDGSNQITENWKPTVPACRSFQERPVGFIDELRLKRDSYLRSVQATKKLHKGPKAETGSVKKPRLSKKDLMLLELQQLVAQKVLEQQPKVQP